MIALLFSSVDSNLDGKRQNVNMSGLGVKWGAKTVNGPVGEASFRSMAPGPWKSAVAGTAGTIWGFHPHFIHIFPILLLQPIFLKCFGRIDTFYPLSEDMDDLSTSSAYKRLHEGSILYGPGLVC